MASSRQASDQLVDLVYASRMRTKRDLRALDIDTSTWEEAAEDRTCWKQQLHTGRQRGEKVDTDGRGEARAQEAK